MDFAETPTLSIAYEASGPSGAAAAVFLHGWPDDVRTWDGVLPSLHAAGFRTMVPYLRGSGPTRFRDASAVRSGQLSALGQDVLDLADALQLERMVVIGHDWGARAAYIASSQAPGRVTHCIALSVGYGTNAPGQRLSLKQIQNYWYHWYMALERGAELVRTERRSFTRHIWNIWAARAIPEEAFEATAGSFDNPDWAAVTLHSYRHRWGLAPGDPAYAEMEAKLAAVPAIAVPTLVLHGGADPCNDPATSERRERFFTGPYDRIVLEGVGHFPQREAAGEVAAAIVRFISRSAL